MKIIDPWKFTPISKSERYVLRTVLMLLKEHDVELLLHPQKDEYYINAKQFNMLVIGCADMPGKVTIVNHKYHYIIPFSQRSISIFKRHFIDETIKRREALLAEYMNNTENSLKVVCNTVKSRILNNINNQND